MDYDTFLQYSGFDGGGYDGFGGYSDPFGEWGGFGFTSNGGGSNVGSGGFFEGLFGGTPGGGISVNIGGGGGGSKPPDVSQSLTAIVNAIEVRLQVNLGSWQSAQISAGDAISAAWDLMNRMVSECSRFGSEGQKAAAERDRRINPGMLRWDWIAYYIDPITGGNTENAPLPGGGAVVGVGPGGQPIYGAGIGSTAFRIDPLFIGLGVLLLLLALRRD